MKRAVAAKRSRDVVSELTIGANTKRVRRVSRREFSSSQLHQRFQQHVAEAQSAFLNGDSGRAEQEATLALRIRPTAHLFALLAVIAESKGHFDRASDLRLVQAFLAKDVVLWEELLHEFLAKQLFYKSVVCLQRLSSLEKHDGGRYRMLQLQLADLLIGLGEIRRATSVLVPLWNSSQCQDFEVFSLLSSLFFQTGKWSSLERLIVSSLQHAFSVTVAQPNPREGEDVPGSSEVTATSAEPPQPSKIRVSKRVRFFGVKEEAGEKTTEEVGSPDGEDNDEFDFDDVGTPTATIHHEHRGSTQESASKAIDGMYGEQKVALETPTAKRNFLTLINVHAELLNETGKFDQTVRLLEYASACLDVPMLELPPDLLVRLVTAYAYQGDCLQPCREVLRHLLDTCSMEEYADVLLDAAVALQKVGVHVESREVFSTLVRYYRFRLNRLEGEITTMESNLEQVRASHKRGNLEMDSSLEPASYQLQELRDETKELKTVIAAALYGSAQCTHSLQSATDEGDSEVVDLLHQALEMDPFNLRARLLLGELLYHNRLDLDGAIAVLTPRDGEPSLQRMQLGAELVKLFRKANKYVEAVALGVSLVELVLSSPEDGDTQSVAPGSSRRGSTMQVLLPTLSRASSAIVPATTLSGMLSGTAASQAGSRLTISLAASIRAGTSVYRQELARRGRSALTTTVYGASAAASIAAGWGREVEEEATKDSSTIFRFHRRRASSRALCRQKDVEDTQALRDQRRREVEAITTMKAENFWEGTALETIKKEENDDAAPEDHRHLEPDNPSGESREATVGPDPVTADLRSRPREVQLRSTDSTAGDRDQDLLDLEQFEATEDAESAAHEDDYLPSLEEVSRRFQDPMMAELFLQASTHTPDPQESSPADASSTIAVPPVGDALPDRVTVKDAVSVLGRHGLLNLAVTIVECYALLGKFTEAKEFAFVALTRFSKKRFFRQMGHSLERPLRLALLRAALASGESEDAYRVGIRLLQEDMTEDQRHEVLEILHGVLSRCEDRSSVLYRLFAEGHCDVPLLILLANRYYQTRSYTRVLNLYLVALEQRPQDIFLNFMVGLCYFLCSHQKKTRSREACISAGTHYFLQYQTLTISLDRSRTGEVLYNTARAMQFLRLHYACVPLYERVANQLLVPEECTMAVKRAAGINLYYFYRWTSSNRVLALNALPAFSE